MEFVSRNQVAGKDKIVVSKIFAEAFYQWLKYFSNDTDKLALAFENAFVMDKFHFATSENSICGMTACTNGKSSPIKLVKKDLVRSLGFIKGNFAITVLKGELENHPNPFDLSEGMCSIEFVAVDGRFRNQGVASGLIKHIIENRSFLIMISASCFKMLFSIRSCLFSLRRRISSSCYGVLLSFSSKEPENRCVNQTSIFRLLHFQERIAI